jgi:predicted acetyltransferase
MGGVPALTTPNLAVHESFVRAMDDFADEGRGAPGDHSALGTDIVTYAPVWRAVAGFQTFLQSLRQAADRSVAPPAGWVHSSTFWWVQDSEFLGSIRVRHVLTPSLLQIGGHIGYDVAPAARRQGHGTAMLRAVLPAAAELGIDQALVTCDHDNVGSRRIIEANGGVFEDERDGKLRYWVPTGRS